MRIATGVILLTLPLCGVASAGSDRYSRPVRVAPFYDVRPGEAVGCYWERGRQHCGSYCYWEVNGRRYCQKRDFNAQPQGARVEGYVLDESRSPHYRRPYSRVRRVWRDDNVW
ncbi:MAG: hypothetical protein ACRCS9_09525 [Hyphomicrobium sp.]